MTLANRTSLIDRTVRHLERLHPLIYTSTLFELASQSLAEEHGLCVHPAEIERTLSALAETAHRPPQRDPKDAPSALPL